MPKPISVALEAELVRSITTPGYLVEILFNVNAPWRASTRGNFKFNGTPFAAYGVGVQGVNGGGGQITVDDFDRLLTQSVLSENVSEARIRVWLFYSDPVENSDIAQWIPWLLFDGYGDDCQLDPNRGTVTIGLVPTSGRTLFTPRLRLTRENGFNTLPPKGRVYEFGGEKFVAAPE